MQDNIFAHVLTMQNNVFKKDRDVLRPSFVPDNLPHRREHLDKLASILAPAFRGDRPSNIIMFGKTGTGKTAVSLFLMNEIKKGRKSEEEKLGKTCALCDGFVPRGHTQCTRNHDISTVGLRCPGCHSETHGDFDTCVNCRSKMDQATRCPRCGNSVYLYDRECSCGAENQARFHRVSYFYINCEVVDTAYGILQNIGNRFAREFDDRIPPTGWSTERVYNSLREKLDEKRRTVIVVLDEIDKLVYKSGDDVLYQLVKLNDDLKNASISLMCISNDLNFTQWLDVRVKSRINEEKLIMNPYDARQLEDILERRVELAFESTAVADGVVQLCAALSAREHGDARRALTLLRVAGEIAERAGDSRVEEVHVYRAKNEIEMDCIAEAVKTLPTQSKVVLLGIILNEEVGNQKMTTGDVYSTYGELARRVNLDRLTQRRITDLISELDMLGLVHARVKSFGRGGRTKEVESSVPQLEAKRIILEDPMLEGLKGFKALAQTTLM